MRTITALAGIVLALCLEVGTARAADYPSGVGPADEAAVRAILVHLEADEPDPHVSPGLDWENAFGVRYHNLKARDAFYGSVVKPQMASASDHSLETKIQFITPDVAVADTYWHVAGQIYGGETKPGPDRWGRTTYIFHKVDGGWTEVIERVADLRQHYYRHLDHMPTPVPVSPTELARYAGRYALKKDGATRPEDEAAITVAKGSLIFTRKGRVLYLVPTSANEFLAFFDPNDFAEYMRATFLPDETLQLSRPWGEPVSEYRRLP